MSLVSKSLLIRMINTQMDFSLVIKENHAVDQIELSVTAVNVNVMMDGLENVVIVHYRLYHVRLQTVIKNVLDVVSVIVANVNVRRIFLEHFVK